LGSIEQGLSRSKLESGSNYNFFFHFDFALLSLPIR
jgi:hypothetical protein